MATEERFKFREDVLRTAASRTRRRVLLGVVAVAAAAAGVWSAFLRPRGGGPGALVLALVLLGLLSLLSLRRRLHRLHDRWSSFEVVVSDARVVRTVRGFPRLAVDRADLEALEERAAGLVVRGRSGVTLLVPREVDGYDRARVRLTGWLAATSS
jgi:hypothetical protein